MRSSRIFFAVVLVAALAALARPSTAQTVTTGSISGFVKGANGAVLPGVPVVVTNLGTGLTRDTISDANGAYSVELLPPGHYRVDADLAGLGKAAASDVAVLLGNSTKADLALTPSISEQVIVVASTPVVDTTRAASANSVTNEQIANLPLLGRDFKSLALLTPGVGEAFGGRIASDGARGLATDYNIDGASSNNDFFGENTGGTRAPFTFSQAAIQEFQVIRSQYDAEFGRGVGAQLNAITKSGTNDFHAEAFVFRRDKDWVSSRPATLSSGQTVVDSFLSRDSTQPGFILGGPIMRGKAFFFVNYDGQRQKQPDVITDIHQRTEFIALSPTLQSQVISKLEGFLGHPYANELNYDTTYNQNTYLAKVDVNLGKQNRISLRDNYTNFENAANQSLGNLSNQGVEHDKFNQLVGQGTTVLRHNIVNDTIVEYSTDQRPIDPTFTSTEIQLTGFSPIQRFGQLDTLPNNTKERKIQFKDTVHYAVGGHEIRVGTDLLLMHIDNLFPRNNNGVYLYSTAQAFVDGTPTTFQQGYGAGGGLTSWTQNTYAFYGMDTLRPTSRLTLDFGVRYDWQTMPLPATNVFPQHPEFITQIKEDKNNIAPRLGWAYDVRGDGKSVIRGGIGKFYGYMPDILLSNPLTQISGNFNQVSITCAAPGAVPCPTFPSILAGDQATKLVKIGTDIVSVASDYQAQESLRGSLQFERELGRRYSASVGTVLAKITKAQGSRNINAVANGIRLGNVPLYDLASPNRKYPDMGVVRELCSCEDASYRSLSLETHRLATADSRLSWDLSYTWARSIDEDTNERSTSTSFLYDPFNPALSRGPSDNDVRHRIAVGGIYRLPLGFLAAGIFTWHTGTPYTEGIAFSQTGVTGSPTSLSFLSQTTGNIPVFVNSSGAIIDLTAANGFSRQQLSAFLAAQDARILGRNTLRQPNSHNVDFRLSKVFNVTHSVHAELLVEVFNLLNTRVESVSGNNLNLVRATYAGAADKFTFTSFASTVNLTNSYISPDPRQAQVGAKIRF
jgi:hypothetical protein